MPEETPYRRFIDAVRERLAGTLPGAEAQLEMAPAYRRKPVDIGTEGKACSEAAVLALFYPDNQEGSCAKMLLTVRPDGMAKHAGQVAFPGGRLEADETYREAALRETEEEVHIPRSDIDVLGRLTPLFIPPTRFCVHPFVGAMDAFPEMAATSDEVKSLFGVTATDLVNRDFRRSMPKTIDGRDMDIPYFAFHGETVWGATAMMLSELAAVVQDVQSEFA